MENLIVVLARRRLLLLQLVIRWVEMFARMKVVEGKGEENNKTCLFVCGIQFLPHVNLVFSPLVNRSAISLVCYGEASHVRATVFD